MIECILESDYPESVGCVEGVCVECVCGECVYYILFSSIPTMLLNW